ncbi:MAG: hypothetical protein AAF654_13080 [Myxococcota bacterium]
MSDSVRLNVLGTVGGLSADVEVSNSFARHALEAPADAAEIVAQRIRESVTAELLDLDGDGIVSEDEFRAVSRAAAMEVGSELATQSYLAGRRDAIADVLDQGSLHAGAMDLNSLPGEIYQRSALLTFREIARTAQGVGLRNPRTAEVALDLARVDHMRARLQHVGAEALEAAVSELRAEHDRED